MERALRRLGVGGESWERQGLFVPGEKILLRAGRRRLVVGVEEIVAITAERDYTRVHLVDGSEHLVHRTMCRWEEHLPIEIFARIHRSAIVNTTRIVRVERGPGHQMTVGLDPIGGDFPVSRRVQSRLRFST